LLPVINLRNATAMANSMLCTYGMDEAFGLATMSGKAQESMQAELRSQVNRILHREMEETVRLVAKYRGALDEMVRILLEKNHLNGEDIDKILSAVVK
jgi:ATP-dependent Zn protease